MPTALLASEVSLFDMNSWFWAICKGLYWVINSIEMAYYYLVGVKPITDTAGSNAPNEVSDILLLNITDPRIQKVFLIFFISGAAILLIFLAIGMIKASFQNDDQLASRGKMIEKAFQAFFVMLFLPLIMYIGVVAAGAFLRLITASMQYALNTNGSSIAENIHRICLPSGASNASMLHWYASYDEMSQFGANTEYQYVLSILASGILIYVLIAICTSLVERLVEVVFFYLIGPFVLARAPLDDGGSFKLWKDIVIAKMLSAVGVILSMYLYFLLMKNINSWFTPTEADTQNPAIVVAKGMVKILFCIGGAFAAKKGALSVAQVISQNTGVSEGMSQGQSLHMLSSGLNLGMSALRGGMMGMLMAGKAGGAGGTSALRTATAGNGRFSAPINTSDAFRGAAASGAGGAASAQASSGNRTIRFVPDKPGAGVSGNNYNSAAASGGAGGFAPAQARAAASGAAPAVDNVATENGTNWTNGVLDNPNAPGEMGQVARARAAGGGLGTAFMYGGGLIGGTVAAGAYLGRKAFGLVMKPVKWAARKIGGAIKKSRPVQAAKGGLVALNEQRKATIAADKQAQTENKANKLNKGLAGLLDKIDKTSGKIDQKYGKAGHNLGEDALSNIKRARLSGQIRNIDRKVKRLTSAGVANQDVLARYNKMTGANLNNKSSKTE